MIIMLTVLCNLATVVPVPGMGDSISEGVVEEFIKGKSNYFKLLIIQRSSKIDDIHVVLNLVKYLPLLHI
jgi:hypothetical protein